MTWTYSNSVFAACVTERVVHGFHSTSAVRYCTVPVLLLYDGVGYYSRGSYFLLFRDRTDVIYTK